MAILRALRRQQQFGDDEVEFDGGVEFVCFGAEQSVQVDFSIVYVVLVVKTSRKKFFSIKHDLARSCFQFWLKIGDEGDKISRKKLARR